MGLVDSAAVALAERLEPRVGPRAALAAFRPLVARTEGDAQRRAIMGALRAAVALGDAEAVSELAAAWGMTEGREQYAAVAPLCFALSRRGLAKAAAELAVAEAGRADRARGHYLAARCLEGAGDVAALDAFARAAERGVREGERELAVEARALRIERLQERVETRGAALGEALSADPEGGSPRAKLAIARARLAAPSPFARATALSMLEELARPSAAAGGDGAGVASPSAIAEAAMRLAAQHADERGDGLSAVESDRVAATLRHWPDAARRDDALARLAALAGIAASSGLAREAALHAAAELAPDTKTALARAQAVLAGAGQAGFPGAPAALETPLGRTASHALDAVVAARRERPLELAEALTRARESLASASVAPALLWTAAAAALASRDARPRESAARLAASLLERPGPPPPRGYASFASALRAAGRGDLATLSLRAAVSAREPGAAALLADELAREGFRLAERGDRDRAIAALRKARELARPRRAAG